MDVKKDVSVLLGILVGGFLFTILIAGLVAYNYGPSGSYRVKDALLNPELAYNLIYNDTNSKTGGMSRFVFDGVEFSYSDASGDRKKVSIPLEKYAKFYELIQSDSSLKNPSEEILRLYPAKNGSTLLIKTRTESHKSWQDVTKTFQEVEILPDSYRIELHEESSGNKWVYYNHPEILQQTLKAFEL